MKNKNIKSASIVTEKEGNEVTLRVRKITNGYILVRETYNPKAKENCFTTEETYYETNPLAEKKSLSEIFTT